MDQPKKPLARALLQQERQAFTSGDAPPEPAQSAVGGNRKILIVDDDAFVLKAFELKLKGCGFTVLTAADASDGIGTARRERPEAVILDLNFPPGENFSSLNWNGMHILQWLKRYKDVADIPIIILTGDDPAKSRDLVLASGAAAFFQKPVELKVFLAELLKLLGDKPRA
jgi:DNA-binding response OmpR family regulator